MCFFRLRPTVLVPRSARSAKPRSTSTATTRASMATASTRPTSGIRMLRRGTPSVGPAVLAWSALRVTTVHAQGHLSQRSGDAIRTLRSIRSTAGAMHRHTQTHTALSLTLDWSHCIPSAWGRHLRSRRRCRRRHHHTAMRMRT